MTSLLLPYPATVAPLSEAAEAEADLTVGAMVEKGRRTEKRRGGVRVNAG